MPAYVTGLQSLPAQPSGVRENRAELIITAAWRVVIAAIAHKNELPHRASSGTIPVVSSGIRSVLEDDFNKTR
jgi:hypothetical protein